MTKEMSSFAEERVGSTAFRRNLYCAHGSRLKSVLRTISPVFVAVSVLAEPASEQEKQELLSVRKVQAEAVVALNEAIATAQALQRAYYYLGDKPPSQFAGEIDQLERRLQELEDQFTILYQAHFGPWSGGGSEPPARKARLTLRSEAEKLMADAARRTTERTKLVADYRAANEAATQLAAQTHASLAALQKKAPRFEPTPDFARRPPATIKADGTPTGVLFGNAGGGLWHSSRSNPAIDVLGFDHEVGGYDAFADSYFANHWNAEPYRTQLEKSAANGQKSTVIVPCAVHREMASPESLWAKWLDGPRKDTNLPIVGLSWVGKPLNGHISRLDFYHPAVRGMMGEYLAEAGARYKGNPHVLWHVTTWEPHTANIDADASWGQWPIDVATPAGLLDFRRYLQRKLGSIEALNKAWKINYKSFDEIQFPPDVNTGPEPARSQLIRQLFIGRCPPLYYEYNRWVKDSYAEWLAYCYKVLKAADPTHPVALSPSFGLFDGYLSTGRDSFLWAETAGDIFGSENGSSQEEMFMYSVRRLTGKTGCIAEYIWNEGENNSDPPEEVVRAVGSRNLWRPIAWGRSALTLYGPVDTYGGGAYNNFLVFESAYNILRRSGGVIETTARRLRSMEDIWLNAPIVEPQIAVLKPSASMICQPIWQAVEGTMQNIHENLYNLQYHYAYVPEEYVLTGKDDLAKYRVLILPLATHFPPGLTEKILPWVKRGGTLIISGIAGGFTPYGELDGALMKEIFGVVDHQIWYEEGNGGDLTWMMNTNNLRPNVKDLGERKYGQTVLAPYGKGQALLVARTKDLGFRGPATTHLYRLLDQAAPRRAWVEGAELEMVLREKGRQLYVVLINPYPHPQQDAAGIVHLAGKFRSAVDRGIEGGFPVPLRSEGRGQAFDIALAPGEGTVIILTK